MQETLKEWRLDPHADEDGFRHAAVAFMRDNETVFDLRAQLWTDAETQPIEDASVDWPTEDSPYRTVATIRPPPRNDYSPRAPALLRRGHDVPARARGAPPARLAMRARLQVCRALSAFRHRENGVREQNPDSDVAIPWLASSIPCHRREALVIGGADCRPQPALLHFSPVGKRTTLTCAEPLLFS